MYIVHHDRDYEKFWPVQIVMPTRRELLWFFSRRNCKFRLFMFQWIRNCAEVIKVLQVNFSQVFTCRVEDYETYNDLYTLNFNELQKNKVLSRSDWKHGYLKFSRGFRASTRM